MQSVTEAIRQMSKNKTIAIITHIGADADAFCSLISLKRLIKKQFETPEEHIHIDLFTDTKNIPEIYDPLVKNVPLNSQRFKKYDLAIAVDCPSLDRLGRYKRIFKRAKDSLLFDHHDTCNKFAKNNIVIKTSSTCEILYLLFILKRDWKASPEIIRLLYAGMITDTNNLTQNVNIGTHKVLADMMQKDADAPLNLDIIRNYFFKNSSKEKMSLLQRALESLQFFENDRIAIMKIVKQDLYETDCKQEDTLGIVDYALNMKGVDIGIIFIKQEDNSYYVSLRSKNNINVGEIAKSFGGGGHLNIAAFQSNYSLTEIKSNLILKCREQLIKHPTSDIVSNLFDEDI